MWVWHKIAWFFQTWYGTLAGSVGILATVFNGVPKMFQAWGFLIERFRDQPVIDLLLRQALLRPQDRVRPVEPMSVGELAKELHRSHRAVGKSIKRLLRKGKIEFYFGGFRLKE